MPPSQSEGIILEQPLTKCPSSHSFGSLGLKPSMHPHVPLLVQTLNGPQMKALILQLEG
jgi:hypothetical protein